MTLWAPALSEPAKTYTVSLAIKLFADSTSTTDYGAMFAMYNQRCHCFRYFDIPVL